MIAELESVLNEFVPCASVVAVIARKELEEGLLRMAQEIVNLRRSHRVAPVVEITMPRPSPDDVAMDMVGTLERAVAQERLTPDTVDAQFCSDWLKGEIKRLFGEALQTAVAREEVMVTAVMDDKKLLALARKIWRTMRGHDLRAEREDRKEYPEEYAVEIDWLMGKLKKVATGGCELCRRR